MPLGTSSRAPAMREMTDSGLFTAEMPRLSWRVMGRTRRLERCADWRRRAWRSGSSEQQRTLQYFAVALFTGAVQPRRAQVRRPVRGESGWRVSRSATTGRSVRLLTNTMSTSAASVRARHCVRCRTHASRTHLCTVWTTASARRGILCASCVQHACETGDTEFLRFQRHGGGRLRKRAADALDGVVGAIGIEPMTSAMSTQRSYQLSYAPAHRTCGSRSG
jgi:hypothetical protein